LAHGSHPSASDPRLRSGHLGVDQEEDRAAKAVVWGLLGKMGAEVASNRWARRGMYDGSAVKRR